MVGSRLLAIASVLLLTGAAWPAAANDDGDNGPTCEWSPRDATHPGVAAWTLTFSHGGGAPLTAIAAHPDTGATDQLVAFAHGYGHNVMDSWQGHVDLAGAVAFTVASDYRDNDGFPVLRGAQDLLAAVACVDARAADNGWSLTKRTMFGVSLGGAVSGIALAEGAPDAFATWFNIEGVAALYETWAAATAVAPGIPFAATARDDIEREAGLAASGAPCPFYACPEAYQRLSPAHRAGDIAANGVGQVYQVHAAGDGLVPYNQGREMAAALTTAGVPVHTTTVLRGDAGSDTDTTPASHGLGSENDVDRAHGVSGHGSENDATQAVMQTALRQLMKHLHGNDPVAGGAGDEGVRDRDL